MGQDDNHIGLGHYTLNMFESFNLYMCQQNVDQCKETLTTKILHWIVDKIDQFDCEMYQNTSGIMQKNKVE